LAPCLGDFEGASQQFLRTRRGESRRQTRSLKKAWASPRANGEAYEILRLRGTGSGRGGSKKKGRNDRISKSRSTAVLMDTEEGKSSRNGIGRSCTPDESGRDRNCRVRSFEKAAGISGAIIQREAGLPLCPRQLISPILTNQAGKGETSHWVNKRHMRNKLHVEGSYLECRG